MSTITLSELTHAGIVATVTDGRLRLSAPPGALTADIRERIAASRDDLLRELSPAAIRTHLLALAADELLPVDLVHALSDADVLACAGQPARALRAYLESLDAGRRFLDRGETPPAWGAPVACTCEACGPVLLWAGCPVVVKACPWCFRRKAGKPIARPHEPPVVRWAREDAARAGGPPYFREEP
ncbi:MAG: hypothetical protein QM581_06305 [Pseudomonas sp.]